MGDIAASDEWSIISLVYFVLFTSYERIVDENHGETHRLTDVTTFCCWKKGRSQSLHYSCTAAQADEKQQEKCERVEENNTFGEKEGRKNEKQARRYAKISKEQPGLLVWLVIDPSITIEISFDAKMYNFVAVLLIVVLGVVVQSEVVEVGLDGGTSPVPAIPKRKLGTQGLEVPPIGLGKHLTTIAHFLSFFIPHAPFSTLHSTLSTPLSITSSFLPSFQLDYFLSNPLGCMGMTAFYDAAPQSEEKSLEAIGKALEKGYNFFDTAWIYQSFGKGGVPNQYNEELLGKGMS